MNASHNQTDKAEQSMSDFEREAEALIQAEDKRKEETYTKFTGELPNLIGEDAAEIMKLFDMKFKTLSDGRPAAQGRAFGHLVTITIDDSPGNEQFYRLSYGIPPVFKSHLTGADLRPLLVEAYAKAKSKPRRSPGT
jgi:hypothetical protein